MTNIEKIEATLKKVADTQLVHARLMDTNERRWNKRFENSPGRTKNLERRTENLDCRIQNLVRVAEGRERRLGNAKERKEPIEDALKRTLASMDKLMKTMDDFIKGRKRQDGHR